MENVILTSIKIVDLQAIIKTSIEEVLSSVNNVNLEVSDEILDVVEAANLLNLTVPTIYSKTSKKEIPHMKRGKKLSFSKNELLKYLRYGRCKTVEEVEEIAQNYLRSTKRRA